MICPRCGAKVRVLDVVHNTEENEIYRKRKCEDCELVFYTTEYEIRSDARFRSDWYKYRRSYG
jgi:transcriptional regulator NrdR family protein